MVAGDGDFLGIANYKATGGGLWDKALGAVDWAVDGVSDAAKVVAKKMGISADEFRPEKLEISKSDTEFPKATRAGEQEVNCFNYMDELTKMVDEKAAAILGTQVNNLKEIQGATAKLQAKLGTIFGRLSGKMDSAQIDAFVDGKLSELAGSTSEKKPDTPSLGGMAVQEKAKADADQLGRLSFWQAVGSTVLDLVKKMPETNGRTEMIKRLESSISPEGSQDPSAQTKTVTEADLKQAIKDGLKFQIAGNQAVNEFNENFYKNLFDGKSIQINVNGSSHSMGDLLDSALENNDGDTGKFVGGLQEHMYFPATALALSNGDPDSSAKIRADITRVTKKDLGTDESRANVERALDAIRNQRDVTLSLPYLDRDGRIQRKPMDFKANSFSQMADAVGQYLAGMYNKKKDAADDSKETDEQKNAKAELLILAKALGLVTGVTAVFGSADKRASLAKNNQIKFEGKSVKKQANYAEPVAGIFDEIEDAYTDFQSETKGNREEVSKGVTDLGQSMFDVTYKYVKPMYTSIGIGDPTISMAALATTRQIQALVLNNAFFRGLEKTGIKEQLGEDGKSVVSLLITQTASLLELTNKNIFGPAEQMLANAAETQQKTMQTAAGLGKVKQG